MRQNNCVLTHLSQLYEVSMEYKYFVSSQEMRTYDTTTIKHYEMPSLVLMERAALAVAEEVEKRFGKENKVLIVAGCGNNGGDGIAVGRLLKQQGFVVDFSLIGRLEQCSEETARHIAIIQKYGCLLQGKIQDGEYDIIIDALFGIGLSRNVEGDHKQAIRKINESNAFVYSVDIPSGINANNGERMNVAVKADITVTFAFEKLGHILYPGCRNAGTVICKDIGITSESFLLKEPQVYSYPDYYKENAKELMPARDGSGNKGTFGKVLVIAGSKNMSGACELCAKGAYRIGAGMVKIITAEENRVIMQEKIPEALLTTYSSDENKSLGEFRDILRKDMDWADCIIIGPGLGKGQIAGFLLNKAVQENQKPLIIDADGINLLAESEELKNYLKNNTVIDKRQVILTPHIVEFVRLNGGTVDETKKQILTKTKELADILNCIVVAKDARTIVASYGEESVFINTTGNDGMATAGSGDVLAGIIGGLVAQGMQAEDAARTGVYFHGILGDRVSDKFGRYAVMAGDLIEQMKDIITKQETREQNRW